MRPCVPVGVVGVLLLAACGVTGTSVDVDADPATVALERQRLDVRRGTTDLLATAGRSLRGVVTRASGRWEGCESAGPEEFRSFHYVAVGRVAAGTDVRRPLLAPLAEALGEDGFTVRATTPRPGGQILAGSRDRLTASFSEVPAQGRFILLAVSGPCLDVPSEDRDDWQRRHDAVPLTTGSTHGSTGGRVSSTG